MPTTFTYSEQHRPFPATGNTLARDGSPLHSRLGIDMMLSTNNLRYSMPFVGYAHDYMLYGHAVTTISAELGVSDPLSPTQSEWFMAQLPTVLPTDAKRFCWTMGIYFANTTDDTSTDVEVDYVTVYLAGAPYTDRVAKPSGPDGIVPDLSATAFDVSKIASSYGVSQVAAAIALPTLAAADGYYLIDNSAGTIGTFLPSSAVTDGGLSSVNLIVSGTGHVTSGTAGYIRAGIADFTWWVLPE